MHLHNTSRSVPKLTRLRPSRKKDTEEPTRSFLCLFFRRVSGDPYLQRSPHHHQIQLVMKPNPHPSSTCLAVNKLPKVGKDNVTSEEKAPEP